MDVVEVEAGGEEGDGVAGVGMVEAMVDMNMITKEVMVVDMDTKADMDTKVDMGTREDTTTKVVMGVMVTTKVDMEDMVSTRSVCLPYYSSLQHHC
jgi:hypothetical protein